MLSDRDKKIYAGKDAVHSFLKPAGVGFSPVIELPDSVNPYNGDQVRIFIKMVQFMPLFNIKALPAYNMLANIRPEDLDEITDLIEYSSGNTVLSLAVFAQYFGIPNMHAIITPDVPASKKRLLQLVGAHLLISHGPASPDVFAQEGGIWEAKNIGQKKSWHNLNQYINEENKNASYKYIGKEIWDQIGDDLSIFVASIGTGGTIYGSGSFLKQQHPNVFILGTAIQKGSSIPGPRGEVMIHKLGIPWEKVTDEVISINAYNAFYYSLQLIRLGLFVGPSTGMQLAALHQKIDMLKENNQLDTFRNQRGQIVCSIIGCDTMFPYIDDYFEVLDDQHFHPARDMDPANNL
ncbi:MAG TPA: hypothetical protein DCQ58_12310 [Saprospirales bacterium]|nr:hypothetical protein [Saprospirales bacterium]